MKLDETKCCKTSMNEMVFLPHPVPFKRTGQEFKKILLPVNLILFCQKIPIHVKKLPRLLQQTGSKW
jgi:hypothetical protein